MSFKKALTKMGLVEDEIQVAKKPATPTNAAPTPTSTRTPVYQAIADVDPTINSMLEKSLEAARLTGFDYLKFVSAVEEMKSTGTSEDARFKMAFFTAKQLGVSKADLVKAGNHYLDVLSEDETDFNADCDQYDKKEVQARENKISQLETTITNLAKQLAQAQEDHETLKQEVQDEKTRLESRKASFQSTLQVFRSTIEANIQKINQYLQ